MKREVIKKVEISNFPHWNKLVNIVMRDGKKRKAQHIIEKIIDMCGTNHYELLEEAMKKGTPSFEIKREKRGGSSVNIPREISEERKQSLVLRALAKNARKRKNTFNHRKYLQKLYREIMDTIAEKSETYKWKKNLETIAKRNKDFMIRSSRY